MQAAPLVPDEAFRGFYDVVLSQIQAFESPALKARAVNRNVVESDEDYEERFRELKRFIGLAVAYHVTLPMTSERIDALWHEFLLDTQEYQRFCDQVVGGFFHHIPDSSEASDVLPPEQFRKLYQRHWDEIPSVWATDSAYCSSCSSCGGRAPVRGFA